MKPRHWWGPLTIALWVLIAVFAGGDFAAHQSHYRYGETVSATIQDACRHVPALRILIGAGAVLAFTHLAFALP